MGGKSSTQSSTVTIPPEVMAQYQQVIGRANQITQKPFQAYSQDPSAFVAPLTSTQQAGIANINAMQGMAQPSVEQGQNMIMEGIGAATPLQYGSLDTVTQGQGLGGALFGQSLGTAAQGRGVGSQLFGQSLGTAAQGTGAAGDIYGQVLPAIQQAAQVGAGYGAKAEPYLGAGLGAAAPFMQQGAGLTAAGLGAGAQFGAQSADYLKGGTQAISPTDFSGQQVDKYMSPYMKNVVEAQQALQAEEAAAQRSALKGQAIASGAFGGDRAGIAQANLARQQSLANQATLANLLQGGYGQALGAFQQQQGVDLAAQQANRAAQQFGSQQAAALGQQQFGQNLAAGSQLSNIGQALFGQNMTQGQALAALGQQLYGQGLGAAQAAAGVGSNIAQMKSQEAALQQAAAQGMFGQAAQEAALQQQAAQGIFGQAAQAAALQQQASNNIFNMANQGGMNYANLGIAGQGAALQGAQAQLGAGQIEQQTDQAAKSAMYNQFLQEQGFPYQQVGFLGNVSMGIGSQSGGTTTTTGGSYSDRRLKENIRKVGETFDGQPIYSFRYKGEHKTQLGLIAQEVEKMHPDAVGERDGYLTVDYRDATDDAAKRGHFASGGLVPSSMGGAVMPTPYGREGYETGGDTGVYDPGPSQSTTPAVNIDPRINELYQKYLFRGADPAGAAQWQDALAKGMSIEDVEKGIAGSKEKQLVNPTSLTYDASKFAAPAAPVQNRYGFYSAPMSSIGSSFTPQALTARRNAAIGMPQSMPTASGKGPQSGSTYTPPPPQQTATGKMPSASANAAPAFNTGRYGMPSAQPTATGKGPSTNAYTGTNNMGYTGSPIGMGQGAFGSTYMPQQASGLTPATTPSTGIGMQNYSQPQTYQQSQSQAQTYQPTQSQAQYSQTPTATGKGPVAGGMANGGRAAYAAGGAADLKDYIDTMSASPRGLAMSHKSLYGMPGERADITKFSEGMLKGRSNVPQASTQQRPQPNMLKEAADFGTSVSKIAELGEKAKNKITEWSAGPKPSGGATGSGQTPAAASSGQTPAGSNVKAEMGADQFGPDMPPNIDPSLPRTNALAFNINDARGPDSGLPIVDDMGGGGGDFLSGLGDLFSAAAKNGGRIGKFDGGPTWGTKHEEGDPSEGAYAPIGPSIDMGEVKIPQASNVPKPGRSGGGGGGGGGGGSLLGSIGQAAGIASTAFSIGKALVTFLPMMFSDERLKKHIKPIGRLYDGQTVYRFDMGGETKIGLIAQEVEKHVPDAVGLAGKYKAVDYDLATAKAAGRKHFFGGGTALNDITADPVKEAIKMAALPPNNDMRLLDTNAGRDVQSDAAPVEQKPPTATGLSPTPATGLSPTPDDRHAETFDRMLGIESGKRQFTDTGAPLMGKAGEGGIAQIKPAAAQEAANYLGVKYDPQRLLTDEKYNMQLGKAYFNMQLDRFGGDPMIAAAAYNAGPTRVQVAMNTAKEKGGDVLDYLPVSTVNYLAKLSDAAQGAHQGLLERQQKVAEASAEGGGPTVVNAQAPGLSPTAQAQAQAPSGGGLGAAMGPKKDWELGGGSILPDVIPKSADFWVPLIAAVGGMLGARAPNAANAIGAGLLSGASAYMSQQEMKERIANQAAQRDIQYKQLGLSERETVLKERQEEIKRKAAEAAAAALRGGGPGMPDMPTVRPAAGAPVAGAAGAAAGTTGAPVGGKPGQKKEEDTLGPQTITVGATQVKLPPLPTPNSDFWKNVDPESNPFLLNRKASAFEDAAIASAYDPQTMNGYLSQAKVFREAARSIRQNGEVTLLDGSTTLIPGFAESKAAVEAAKTKAQKDVERKFQPVVTPGGAKVSLDPDAQAAAAGEPSTSVNPPASADNRPKSAAFDIKTGKMSTAIPTAPDGGGFQPVQAPAGAKVIEQSETNKEIAKNDGLFYKDFLEKLPKTDVAISRYKSMANAFKLTQAGATAEALAAWSAFAESYGMTDLARRITNNDPAAVELIKKEAPNMVLETLSAANPRFAQSEFISLKDQGTPSPDKLPRTNFQMVADGMAMLERQKSFARDWQQAQKEGWQSPSAFWTAWSDANPLSQFQTAARRQLGNFKGMDLPPSNDWSPGAIYVVPDKLEPGQAAALAKQGVKSGELFRFNGWDADKKITPIPKGKGFEAYLETQ